MGRFILEASAENSTLPESRNAYTNTNILMNRSAPMSKNRKGLNTPSLTTSMIGVGQLTRLSTRRPWPRTHQEKINDQWRHSTVPGVSGVAIAPPQRIPDGYKPEDRSVPDARNPRRRPYSTPFPSLVDARSAPAYFLEVKAPCPLKEPIVQCQPA